MDKIKTRVQMILDGELDNKPSGEVIKIATPVAVFTPPPVAAKVVTKQTNYEVTLKGILKDAKNIANLKADDMRALIKRHSQIGYEMLELIRSGDRLANTEDVKAGLDMWFESQCEILTACSLAALHPVSAGKGK